MISLSPVVWSEGMHLSPHHFQTQARYFEELQLFTTRALLGDAWGLQGIRMDPEALRNGSVEVLEARGILPDGLPFRIPGDPAPDPLALEDVFSPTASSQRILLEIPAHRPSGPNSSAPADPTGTGSAQGDPDTDDRPLRFRPLLRDIRDQVTGDRDQSIALAGKNLRLVVEPEGDDGTQDSEDGVVRMPIARVRRDGAGRFEYDPGYIPPTLHIGGSEALSGLLERLVQMLDERARTLADQRRGLGRGSDTAELTGFWFTHAVNAHLPILRHHMADRQAHPSRLFRDLSSLAGALTTFSLTARATDLPSWDHTDPGPAFRELESAIRQGLEAVTGSSLLRLPVRMGDGYFHTAAVPDPRAFQDDMHWYMGVRSSAPRSAVVGGIPRLAKLCSARHIERLVREAYPGMGLEHVQAPPRGLPAAPGTEYFRVRRSEPCWRSIVDTGEVGIYLPESVVEPELELVVLPDPDRT
ncbi:MAG: type VI secretion system baseplate subunit TssK [Gemmatimonadales bacterium]|nr:MAG: type VI secretion system baseplate subunit TssK [Gemmatimonadales bacterium]